MRVKTILVKNKRDAQQLAGFPSFSKTGSITGMKRDFYGKDALLVRCGSYIYNVSSKPDIYHRIAK